MGAGKQTLGILGYNVTIRKSSIEALELFFIDLIMWTNIEKTYCFIRHIGTVITAQDVIVAFFATASTIAINDERKRRSMRIKNIKGTSQNTCKCGSWLNHWTKFSGMIVPSYCPAQGCHEEELVGAHVQMDSSSDNSWYIFPLCKTHNVATESLEVSDDYKLVSANVSQTCG